MKRIGIDARLWGETGVGRYIRNLVKELQEIDKENEYVLFALSKNVRNIQLAITNDQWRISIADIPWHGIKEQVVFPQILEKEKLDLVHFPYFSVPIGYKGKYVLTIHDLILHHFPTGKASTHIAPVYWLKHLGYEYILSSSAKKAEKIIVVSNATKEEIVKHLHMPEEKIIVTYEGVDQMIKEQGTRIIKKTKDYFLYVGNAYPHKNLETLVEAFTKMINDQLAMIKDVTLIFVGKQDYFYKRLEEQVKEMGLESFIEFRHDVSDEELALLYARALALVVPSRMEGFGLPLLEAMANNCLVVASDIPVFHEIGQDVPIYFNPTHVQELRNVLESITKGRITDGAKRKEKGKEIVSTFSWKKMAEETLNVYNSVLR